MSTIPPVPAGDPPFTPNPDFALNVNAAAAAYAVEVETQRLVDDILAIDPKKSDIFGGSDRFGMSRREFAQGFRVWREFMAGRNFDRSED